MVAKSLFWKSNARLRTAMQVMQAVDDSVPLERLTGMRPF